MAAVNALVIAQALSFISVDVPNLTATLGIDVLLVPLNGTPTIVGTISTTQLMSATAATWKTAFLAAIVTWAATPPGSPDVYTITRLIGFVDLLTTVP